MSNLELKEREGVWYAVGTINGERIRKSLGTRDRKRAEEQVALYEARLWKRHSFGEEAVRTFEEAAVSYLKQGGEGRFLPPILRHFKGRSLGKIKPGDVRDMAVTLFPKAANATRNRQAITPAVAVINHGADRGWCAPIKVKSFDVPKSRKHKPVDRAWLNAFMAEADKSKLPHLSAIVLFMHQTGARASEAVNLTGECVDLGKRIAVLAKTKTEEDSVRHLTVELVSRLAALGIRKGENVFLYTDPKAVNRRMKAVAKRAGIEERTTHSAGRHSFGTNVMNAGARVKDAMDAGGWKSAKLFMETYVHTSEAGKKVANLLDGEAGPIDTNATRAVQKQRRRFGKQK
jgi:integrase